MLAKYLQDIFQAILVLTKTALAFMGNPLAALCVITFSHIVVIVKLLISAESAKPKSTKITILCCLASYTFSLLLIINYINKYVWVGSSLSPRNNYWPFVLGWCYLTFIVTLPAALDIMRKLIEFYVRKTKS